MAYRVLGRIASNTYKGLNAVGRGIKAAVNAPLDAYENKLKDMDHEEMTRNIKMINENFGSVDEYLKTHEEAKKKKLN